MTQKVVVLMSTYNGETYLRHQLDTILNQTWENTEIFIRDDGSKDGTLRILEEYASKHENVSFVRGENLGSNRSFLELIQNAPEADYYALSDQDDDWMPKKLSKAIEKLEGGEYLIYCGNKQQVDNDLLPLPNQTYGDLKPGFENAVIENICTGCTCVFTKKMQQLLKDKLPEHPIYHDWWLYLVASYHGKVYFDKEPFINYRQHGDNQVGATVGLLERLKVEIKFFQKQKGQLRTQLTEFHNLYHGDKTKDALVESLLFDTKTFGGSLGFVFGHKVYRQAAFEGFACRILFLLRQMI